jgi:hypothetical protein
MASLYEQLMASKGAPKAAAASNSTQLRKAPMSLRSAMRKYAAGGDVTDTAPDYSRAYGAFGGAGVVNDLRNQFLNMGVDENTIGSIFSKYYAPETSQPAPQTMMPPEPVRPPPPEEPRYQPPQPPEKPIYEEPRLYEEPLRPRNPDRETPYIAPQQPQGPQTSYRINDDGSRTEIGYDGQPVANYTPEQLAMHNATTGVTPSEYRYVWNGEGYTKVPNGSQTGYGPTPDIAEPKFPERERPPEPRYEEPQRPDPMDFRREQEAEEERRREQESRDRQREAEEYYFRMRNAQSEQPRYEEPIAPQMPYYPEEPMPETYIEPEVNFPTDPGFYQPPVDYYNPSPPMDFTQDPGFAPTPTPIGIAKSLERGGDIGKLLQDLTSRSGGQNSEGLAALIAKALARNGGGGSLDEQRRLMELLGSIRG